MSLKDALAARGIVCAHVIDDAYDPLPAKPFDAEQVQGVLDALDDLSFQKVSEILGVDGVDGSDEDRLRERLQSLDGTRALCLRRAEIPEDVGAIIFGRFDADQEGKRSLIRPLIELLEANGVTCEKHGTDYPARPTAVPQLFFVDLVLAEGDIQHRDAARMHAKLKREHPESRPFIFLMSSLSTMLDALREDFREDADLFQSEFEGVDKSVFSDRLHLERLLISYTGGMPTVAELRRSMEAAEAAVRKAASDVMRGLRRLDLADYFALFHSTTSLEKITLGAYIIQLLLESLSHEIEGQADIWELANALDGLSPERLPRARFGLSQPAVELYSSTMLHSQEMLLAEGADRGPAQGHFYLGDVYFEARSLHEPLPSVAWAVITPACDLIRPDEMKGKSVLLCEGSIEEWSHDVNLIGADGIPLVVMRHPTSEKRLLTIRWKKKKLRIWDDEERGKFASENCAFVRVTRLRPLFSLQLQRAVTSDLSRVGTLKPPRALTTRTLACFVADGAVWREVYRNSSAAASATTEFVDTKKKKRFVTYVLSDQAVNGAVSALEVWMSAQHVAPDDRNAVEQVVRSHVIDAIRGFIRPKPEKAAQGQPLDVTAYPLDQMPAVGDRKLVAVVPGSACPSPYAEIRDGKARDSTKQPARVVLLLDEPAERSESPLSTDGTAS